MNVAPIYMAKYKQSKFILRKLSIALSNSIQDRPKVLEL